MIYKTLLRVITDHARTTEFDIAHYVGTKHKIYNVVTPMMHDIARAFQKANRDMTPPACVALVNRLFHAPSFEEKIMATMILGKFPKILVTIPTTYFDDWMGLLTGWAEVNSFCDEIDIWLRSDPNQRIRLLKQWNTDPYLEKRRASLVVLCSTVRHDKDVKWKTLAFRFIGTLTHQKHVMITKAISWLLRALIKHHKEDVRTYLAKHAATLPKIAIREATRKLETGKK